MQAQIDEIISSPRQYFTRPDDVLREDDLTNEEKRRILESWKLDESRLADSTSENMSGGEESHLREISKSLLQLKAMDKTPDVVRRPAPRPRKGIGLGTGVGAAIGLAAGLVLLVAYPGLAAFPILIETIAIGALAGGLSAALRSIARA
ncbi:MAG: hypothetical protein GC155_06760 [Alphaproteobacteria bacterium]|nr:hypothetical protein [Alphaproteobacteria bacterium]